jgi:cysteine desulfurase
MSDTTQAAGKMNLDVDSLGIDILCLSGHKMHAPKGIGVLYTRQGSEKIKLPTFIHGGGHEKSIRSGTLNVPGVIALAKACEIAKLEMEEIGERICTLRDILENNLLKIPGTFINGDKNSRIKNVTNICFPSVDANILIGTMKNIAVSNGSACSSNIVEPSHVLTKMGLSADDAFASIRFSLGKYNTKQDVILASQKINELLSNQLNYA